MWKLENYSSNRKGYMQITKDGKRVADVFPWAAEQDAEWTVQAAREIVDQMNERAARLPQPPYQRKPQPGDEGYPTTFSWWSRDKMVGMNYAFGCALVDAIHKGLERYPLRPKVDEAPWVPTQC